jgi:hypothetical protein
MRLSMSRGIPELPEYRPTIDPDVKLPPVDPAVKLPRQHQLAIERAEDLVAGRLPRLLAVASAKISTDAIDAVLERWPPDQGAFDPDFQFLLKVARELRRVIEARRRGAQKTSEAVTRRLEALFQAYCELPSALQQQPTSQETVARLRGSVSEKVGLPGLSELTVRQDIRQIRPLLRSVQNARARTPELEERTRQEQEAGRRAVARFEANPGLDEK